MLVIFLLRNIGRGFRRIGCWGGNLSPHNEELYALYSSSNIIQVIKSRIMRWAGHVALMGRGEVYTGFWW
jgi:hypothetical protein